MTFSHSYGMISLRRLSKPDIRLKTGNWMGKFDKTFYRTYLRWQMSRNVQKVYLYNAFFNKSKCNIKYCAGTPEFIKGIKWHLKLKSTLVKKTTFRTPFSGVSAILEIIFLILSLFLYSK